MNVFQTHSRVIRDYSKYIGSFLKISDPQIRHIVENELQLGKLWPEPLLQFNPSYEMAGTVDSLCKSGLLHPDISKILRGYSLYKHQVDAIKLGIDNKDFIVTSGTGSGKSLTYIGSIFHQLLSNPIDSGINAVIVYPMNALINSQTEEFTRYKSNFEKDGSEFPIRFAQYTGQEKEDSRKSIRENPPHILLTNYMMLELLLTRVQERSIRDSIFQNLQFLVFDELHTYRGRQGADVAMLIRRIRSRCEHSVTCVGTSATMVSVGSASSQKEEVASVATTLFGKPFHSDQVVTETLSRSLSSSGQIPTQAELSSAIESGINPDDSIDSLRTHPVAIWLENRIALEENEGILLRRTPQRFSEIVASLSKVSGQEGTKCRQYLEALLQWISVLNGKLQESGQRYTVLPFKLHQFISQTGSVYTTLDQDDKRFVTLEPGVFKQDEEEKKPIYPNVFSRATGHPFICVSLYGNRIEPREFRESTDDDEESTDGYLIVGEDVWDPTDDLEFLPSAWLRITKKGVSPDSKKKAFFPKRIYFDEFGNCSESEPLSFSGWFMKAPLLFDPTGGVFYDAKTNEGTKLAKLGSEGRGTSTTITAFSILNQLNDAGYRHVDQKLLSFTDNRQDAALQAGHFNDFVQVVHLRAAIHKALKDAPGNRLTYFSIGEAVFKALNLSFLEYANRNEEPPLANVRRKYEECLQTYLVYRAISDLKRSWRIILPNLEQCALLSIEYMDLKEVASTDEFWADVPLLCTLNTDERESFLNTILDFFRLEYAIHSENYLTQTKIKENEKQFHELLRAPWTLDRNEELKEPYFVRYETLHRSARLYSKSMGQSSALGKFIKLYAQQNGYSDLKGDAYRDFIMLLVNKLEQADYLKSQTARNQQNEEIPIYRLRIEKIVWALGDKTNVKTDLIKRRSYKDQTVTPNYFFQELYSRDFTSIKRLRGEDHTGQLSTDARIEREDKFRSGTISALFCSPTMELGIDIGGLSVVHMRNAPPNPANYAQRSGRAGRSGQGALAFTYCSSYSPHDRHYFEHQVELVAGAVQAPRLDLCNQELLLSHLNALAISELGLPGLEEHNGYKPSIMRLIVDDNDKMPLSSEVHDGLTVQPGKFNELKSFFRQVVRDIEPDLVLRASNWYSDQWIDQHLTKLADNVDSALERWRTLYRSAREILTRATQQIESGTLGLGSDEYRKYKRNQDQATRQLDLLRNEIGKGSLSLSEFYPFRYFASEGFLPGYNFTRLPIRIFLPTSDSSGEFISRPRSIALREYGPLNIVYYNGRKYRVSQLITQDAESCMIEARVSKKAGYFLTADQKDLEMCPFTGLSLGDNVNRVHLHHLVEMAESRAEEVDRISCEEEERVSRGFEIRTFFSIDGGQFDRVKKAIIRSGDNDLLNLRFIAAARLVHVNLQWRAQQSEGFPLGMVSGNWRSSIPDSESHFKENYQLVKLWTSNLADALYIEPTQPLGLDTDGVITLQYALKRGIENVFQVEPNEIGVVSIGDPAAPNILIFESSEGSLGILSQFVENPKAFGEVVEKAIEVCQYDDETYKGPASYSDLLSYFNQRDHKIIDRHLIKDALEKLRICTIEIQTNPAYKDYEDQYQTLLRGLDPNSSTELKFIEFLYNNGLRLPDAAQKRVDGVYVQPDFYYEPRVWVFCDGTPHDKPEVKEDDQKKRQAIIAQGHEVWVYNYRDNLADMVASRPDIFRKVR